MDVAYLYTKTRSEFGKHCGFEDVPARVLKTIPSTDDYKEEYLMRNPSVMELDTSPLMSEHEVGTERVLLHSIGMRHREGGWPKDVDIDDQDAKNRFRKKAEKGVPDKDGSGAIPPLGDSVTHLAPVVDRAVRQNNTIDIYEEYFADGIAEHSSEPPSAKGLAVFRDPSAVKRTVTSIDWHPEGPTKIAVSYSILNFQDPRFMSERMPPNSYIWDVMNPNTPDQELIPASPLCCLRFNPSNPETLVGGSYNGLISFYDLRKSGARPHETSVIESSHHDPVYDVYWIKSKTGNLCASVSTDGQMLWWDTRRLGEPTEVLQLNTKSDGGSGGGQVLGGSSLAYNTEAGPTKYLVGTEQGVVLSVNLRNKKVNNGITVYDRGAGKHHGPIYSIQRNPTHSKFFMTVGDWTARIWVEDLKTPIMTTKYHASYLTAGCWSPTRPGVFMVTRMDGVVDVWDYFYKQNEVAYSHKVGDVALSSIAVQGTTASGGRLVAVGDANGTVSLLELCDSLAAPQSNEKAAIASMFERETKREKNLEARAKDIRRRNKQPEKAGGEGKAGADDKMEELLRQVEDDFLQMMRSSEADGDAVPAAAAAAGGSPMRDTELPDGAEAADRDGAPVGGVEESKE